MSEHTPESDSVLYWHQCNIERNEESFGVVFFIIFRKQINYR